MGTPRFTPEFKEEAVRQITERGYSVAEVSDRLGVSAHSLYKWLTPEALLLGFHEVIAPHLNSHGITGKPAAPRWPF